MLAVRRPQDLGGRRRGRVDRQRAAAGGGVHPGVSPHIVAMGGAELRPEDYDPRLNAFVLSLARRARPRVCFVGTASGDSPEYVANFYGVFSADHDCEPSDLGLFERTVADLRRSSLRRTSSTSAAATRRACSRSGGPTVSTRCCARRGSGRRAARVSAGTNCWFEAWTTDSFGLSRRPGCATGSASCPERLPALRRRGPAPPALPAAGGRGGLSAPPCGRRRRGAGVRGDVAGRGGDHGSGRDCLPGGGGRGGGTGGAAARERRHRLVAHVGHEHVPRRVGDHQPGREATATACGVTPQAQKTGSSPARNLDGVAVVGRAEVLDADRGRLADVDGRTVDRRVALGDLGGADRERRRHRAHRDDERAGEAPGRKCSRCRCGTSAR